MKIGTLTNPKILLLAAASIGILGSAVLLFSLSFFSPSQLWTSVSNSLTPQPAYGDVQIKGGPPAADPQRDDFFSSGFDDFFNLNRDFERMVRGRLLPSSGLDSGLLDPSNQTRIHDDGESYTVSVDLPGADKKSIDLRVERDSLRVSSERTEQREDQSSQSIRRQNFYGRTSRTIQLPSRVKKEGASAKYDNGVLTISVQKDRAAETSSDRIEIQ